MSIVIKMNVASKTENYLFKTELRINMNSAKFINYNVLYRNYSRFQNIRVRKYITEENVVDLKF